jgi:hypothetical protein
MTNKQRAARVKKQQVFDSCDTILTRNGKYCIRESDLIKGDE